MTVLRTRWLIATAVLAAAVVSVTAGNLIAEIAYQAVYMLICAAAWWAALRPGDAVTRRPWVLIAVGQTLLLIGDTTATVFYYFLPETDPTGWIDAPWLSGYAAIGVAIMIMARRRSGRRLREPLLDMLTLTSAAALGMWRLIVAPALEETDGQYTLGIILEASYTVGDVVIMAAVLLLVLSSGTRGAPTRLMIAAGFFRLVADIGLALAVSTETFLPVNGVVLLANALMVITALRPDRDELTRPARQTRTLHPARVVFLGLALLTAPVIAVVEGSVPGGQRMALLLATVTASGFVLTRFAVAVRQQERAEQQLIRQAAYDPLTGLANRRTLHTRMEECATGDVLLYLDLDGFKAVNDTHGHEAGDALLIEIGRRLSAAVREEDLVVRLGGDEFALLCPQSAAGTDLVPLAERILASIAEPVVYGDHELRVGTSIGVAVFREGVTTPGDLIRDADAAMYQAKRGGRGRWVLAESSGESALSLVG
ncbi:diguanylate cyclase domain-containing protein [Planobispora siamensis]|nr:diguanylate cyclase [Planobispora siamensis]